MTQAEKDSVLKRFGQYMKPCPTSPKSTPPPLLIACTWWARL